jgi:hypothetical protein
MYPLDEYASAMLRCTPDALFNPPALTNFLGCLQAARDVLGVQHLTFPPYSHGDSILGGLTIDGVCVRTSGLPIEMRWWPDRIERRVLLPGLCVESTTVMGVLEQSATLELRVTNQGTEPRSVLVEVATGDGVVHSTDGWRTPYSPKEGPAISTTPWEGTPPPQTLVTNSMRPLGDGSGLLFSSRSSVAFSLQATEPRADEIDRRRLGFSWSLSAGETRVLHYLVTVGGEIETLKRTHERWRRDPARAIARAREDWSAELAAVFTPGNTRYSGHLPTLRTSNADLARIYRTTVVGVVYFKRLTARGRTYTTLMPRYWVTTSFLNDWSLSAWLLAMLDPACVRDTIELWLAQDIHGCFGTEYVSGVGTGNWYSCNDFAITRLMSVYVQVSGDTAWLEREVAGRSVLRHLERAARHLLALGARSGLGDFGDRNSLLECVGNYTHEVASLNAASVWTLREVASWLERAGEAETAAELRREASELSARLRTLYSSGKGYWYCRQPDGSLVPTRHAWDFVHVLVFVGEDLPRAQVDEMMDFFERELMTPTWMAALSPLDDDVDFSLRPDHQWNGSYPAWVALAARALGRFGREDLLARWLPGLAASTNQGPYSQAHFVESFAPCEAGGARKAPTEWPFITDWAIVCVGGFFELLLFEICGARIGIDGVDSTRVRASIAPDTRLENVPLRGCLVQFPSSDRRG